MIRAGPDFMALLSAKIRVYDHQAPNFCASGVSEECLVMEYARAQAKIPVKYQ